MRKVADFAFKWVSYALLAACAYVMLTDLLFFVDHGKLRLTSLIDLTANGKVYSFSYWEHLLLDAWAPAYMLIAAYLCSRIPQTQ
ncbi:MAG: hypothetical protein ABJN26_12290 [Stappiaceae bacterium]